tara:strand:- start:1538 stop:2293 length:756 start_codon:yes stop_codon:yes gene_type:complete
MSDHKGEAVLFSEMTPPDGAEKHFNDWYNSHHMPSHVYGVPGFRSGQRYKDKSKAEYLAIYELESPETLQDKEYINRKYTPDAPTKKMLSEVIGFTRYISKEISFQLSKNVDIDYALDAPSVCAVFIALPEKATQEFLRWYEKENTPALLASEQWRMVRNFEVVNADPNPFTHMFLHYVESDLGLESKEKQKTSLRDWTKRFAVNDRFETLTVHYGRIGKRYHKAEPDAANFTLLVDTFEGEKKNGDRTVK